MYIFLAVLMVLLFLKVFHQSFKIRELKGFLESLKNQIKVLREQFA
jgi:predicted Holliday junction resolvase-like endonuclease